MTTISIRLDDYDKKDLEAMCAEMGMSITTFFTICAKKALRERRIPFEVAASPDPFYSERNMAHLRLSEDQVKAGKVVRKSLEELEALADE